MHHIEDDYNMIWVLYKPTDSDEFKGIDMPSKQ